MDVREIISTKVYDLYHLASHKRGSFSDRASLWIISHSYEGGGRSYGYLSTVLSLVYIEICAFYIVCLYVY
jgi:hypothetical protein